MVAADLFAHIDEENFGSFAKSLFSLFQMSTGDSWASSITRGVMATQHSGVAAGLVAAFFVSYMLVVSVVMVRFLPSKAPGL
jgi:hypothetical protein